MQKPKLLAVLAHPDDEAFRCGGTLALLAQQGIKIHLLTFTRGQAGSCGNPPICTREALGDVRAQELACSCRVLGLEPPTVLDYEDGALMGVSQAEAVAQIIAQIRILRPQVLLTWPLDGLSGHADHRAVSQWATTAYQQDIQESLSSLAALYYLAVPESVARELEMTQLRAIPDNAINVTVPVRSVWEQKMAAIQCHRTQAGESPILQAPLERQYRFLGWEHFYRAQACQPEDVLLKFDQDSKEPRTE